MNRRGPLVAAVTGVAAIALVAACTSANKSGSAPPATNGTGGGGATSSPNDLGPAIVNGGYTTKGGTVNILMSDNFEHLDPVQNYVTNSGNFGKLIYRTLTVIDDTPGKTPEIKPDLAESLGTPNADKSVWTYHIRKGLKYEDGTPITAKDVKYNIERSFAEDVYKDGATYMPDTLQNPNNYAGPYKDPNKDLSSVQTPDDYTLVFHFQGPQPDANWMMSLFYTAPVPKAKDTKQDYDFHPVSSGPYKIASYTPSKEIVLARNPNWDPSTDPNRPALPDKFVATIGVDATTISSRLIANQGADQTALSIDNSSDLQASDVPKLRDPNVKSRFVNGATPCVFYIFFNEQKIKDVNVRKAIAEAINRQAVIQQMNGPLFGSIPDNYMSVSTRGYQPANLGLKETGDIAAAKATLGSTSVPTLHYAVSAGRPVQGKVAVEVQNDLKQLGINVVVDKIPTSSFYKTLRSANAPDMGMAGWCWDWPTLAAVVPPVLGPDSTGKTWNSNNFSRFFDPTISKTINDLAVSNLPDTERDQQFIQVSNQALTSNWPLLPIQANLNPAVSGSKIRNFGISTVWALPDLNIIGVQS